MREEEMSEKTIFGMIPEATTEKETAASTITEASRFTPLLWTEERTIPNAETIDQIASIAVTRADTALVATVEASSVMTVIICITAIAPILLITTQSINQSHYIISASIPGGLFVQQTLHSSFVFLRFIQIEFNMYMQA